MDLPDDIEEYLISALVDRAFNDYKYWHLDFRRHLKKEVALTKDVSFDVVGRPIEALYTFNDVLYAKLKWTFINLPNSNLMGSRKEEVLYILNNGSEGPTFTVKEDFYDIAASPYHKGIVLQERVKGRSFILDDLKGTVLGSLKASNPTLPEMDVIEIGSEFFDTYSSELSTFKETGSKKIVTSTDTDTSLPWLDDDLTPEMPGYKIRDHIKAKLNF